MYLRMIRGAEDALEALSAMGEQAAGLAVLWAVPILRQSVQTVEAALIQAERNCERLYQATQAGKESRRVGERTEGALRHWLDSLDPELLTLDGTREEDFPDLVPEDLEFPDDLDSPDGAMKRDCNSSAKSWADPPIRRAGPFLVSLLGNH